MKVKINEEACIGCGACEAICPEVFELNDEGISTCKKKESEDKEVVEKIREAVDTCPTGAILEEKEDKE